MITTLTIVRYPRNVGWAGFLSMAIFRFPMWVSNKIVFWKLMGCGKNGTFDKTPDWRQWAILISSKDEINTNNVVPSFIVYWWKFWKCEKWTLVMEPIEGHGTWDGKKVFGTLPKQSEYDGPIGILTRATIRLNKLNRFWQHVDEVAKVMTGAKGFIVSVGIGEVPWIKQATFSIWESKTMMKEFAYQMKEHATVVQKTRKENWYSEEMFVRFKIIESNGHLNGRLPFDLKHTTI